MKTPDPFSTQSRVRGALRDAGTPLRVTEIRDLIGLEGESGYNRVHRAICDLQKAGQCERAERGRYRYVEDRPEGEFCRTQRTMQRIMWMRSKNGNPFTARKVSELAGCSLYTAQKYLSWLTDKGVLRPAGRAQVSVSAYAPLYLGADAWLGSDAWPVMRAQSRTRLLEACLNEMREIAGRFFALEGLDQEALSHLRTSVSRLGELVTECEKIKGSLRQSNEEGDGAVPCGLIPPRDRGN